MQRRWKGFCRYGRQPVDFLDNDFGSMNAIHVTIVDDDVEFLQDCRDGLQAEGLKVTTFEDVESTKRALTAGEIDPDVFIVDVHFPDGSTGFDFVRWLRVRDLDSAVVVATSSDETSEAFEAAKSGADAWLEKSRFIEPSVAAVSVNSALSERFVARRRAVRRTEKILSGVPTLIGEVTHELGNILVPVRNNAELLAVQRNDGYFDCPPDTGSAIEAIFDDVTRSERLIKDLETYASTGSLALNPVAMDVVDIASLAVRGFEEVFASLTPTGKSSVQVVVDPHFVENTIHPILKNIEEHVGRSANVCVDISIRVEAEGKFLETAVYDDGPGIPSDLRPSIFLPGIRGDHTRKTRGKGIGLAVVARYAQSYVARSGDDSLRGEVACTDRPDGHDGACFIVRLPVQVHETRRLIDG